MSNGTLAPPEVEDGLGLPVPPTASGPTRRGLGSRLSFGHVLTAIAGILTFLFLMLVLADRNNPEATVIVASQRIDEGVPLTADLFEEVQLPEDNALVQGAVKSMNRLDGSRTAQRDIPPRSVLVQSDFQDVVAETPGGGLRSLSIPIEPDRAVGGKIRDSDLVDILAVDGGRVWIPAAGLEVLDDGDGGSGGGLLGGGSDGGDFLTMAVTADEAVAISYAASNAKDIYIVRSTGAEKLPKLEATSSEVGVGGPSEGASFVPADIAGSINEAIGGVFDEFEESTDG